MLHTVIILYDFFLSQTSPLSIPRQGTHPKQGKYNYWVDVCTNLAFHVNRHNVIHTLPVIAAHPPEPGDPTLTAEAPPPYNIAAAYPSASTN